MPPCQEPGVVGSVLGLVGPVSVYCDWVRWKVWSATSVSVWQHVQLSEQIRPWDTLACCWDVKHPTNKQTKEDLKQGTTALWFNTMAYNCNSFLWAYLKDRSRFSVVFLFHTGQPCWNSTLVDLMSSRNQHPIFVAPAVRDYGSRDAGAAASAVGRAVISHAQGGLVLGHLVQIAVSESVEEVDTEPWAKESRRSLITCWIDWSIRERARAHTHTHT